MKTERRQTIDHLDSNKRNNTIYNLSLMNVQLNGKKSEITARFMEPVVLHAAVVDDEYRICMQWYEIPTNMGDGSCSFMLRCCNAALLLECLNELADMDPDWYKPLRYKHRWEKGNGQCWTADADKSIKAQHMIAVMRREMFNEYTGGTIGSLKIKDILRVIAARVVPAELKLDAEEQK